MKKIKPINRKEAARVKGGNVCEPILIELGSSLGKEAGIRPISENTNLGGNSGPEEVFESCYFWSY